MLYGYTKISMTISPKLKIRQYEKNNIFGRFAKFNAYP